MRPIGQDSSDTSPETLEALTRLHREMTPREKIARVFDAIGLINSLIAAKERRLHPDASEREIHLRAAHRLGWQTVRRVCGWPPDDATRP